MRRQILAWETVPHAERRVLPRSPPTEDGPKPSTNDVDQVHNFFEDVALRYNQGEILHEPVISSIGYAAAEQFCRSLWLIHYDARIASDRSRARRLAWALDQLDNAQIDVVLSRHERS